MIKLPRVIDSNGKEIKRLHPIAESINEKIVPLSYATLQVMKDEAVDERSYVELYTINGFSGIYRTRAPQKDVVGDTVTLQLEHAISEVGDWLIQDAYDEEITVRNAFVKVFSHYRGNKWQLGSFTATETVHLDVDYDNILETMIGIAQQQPKYYMTFNFGTTPWTVSLAQKSNTISAEGRLSRNISNVIVKRDDKDLCTRVYVKGLPKPAGRADDENAIGYMDADTQALYGIVEAQTGGSDLTVEQATRVAETYLAIHKHPKLSAEVDGYDFFNATGETIDKVEIAKKYRLTIPSKSVIVEDYITAINWRDVYNNPESVSIVVGDEQDPTIDFFKDQQSAAKSSRRSARKQAKKNESFDQHFEITDEYGSILNQAGMHLDAYGMLVYARDNVNNIGSIIDMTASYLSTKIDDGDNDLHSEILQTQSMIRSAVWTANSEVFSYIDQTATYIISGVEDTKNDLHSEILETQNMIHSAVWTANSEVFSYIDQTSTYIQSVVADTRNDLHSEILETQNMIHSAVWTANSEVFSYIDQTSTYILSVVGETANDLGSAILQTASEIRSEVHVANSALYSYVDQTATYIVSVIDNTAMDIGTAILQTASQIRSEAHAANSTLYSYVDQTATYINSVVEDTANDLGSAILQTASQIRSEIHANDSALFSYVDQTATYIESVVQDTANSLGSAILQTASEIRSEIHANDSALFSYVDQTATYIESVVASTASSLGSAILQTASQIRSEVHAADSSIYSYVDQTASGIRQEVANTASGLQSSINQQANRIGLVVEGTGSNAHIKPASIVAAINEQTGSSIATISADKILLDGSTTLHGALSIVDGKLYSSNGIQTSNITVNSGGYVRLIGSATGEYYDLTTADVDSMLIDAQVDPNTNTLKIWKKGDPASSPSITFSKAASVTALTGSWSGGTLTVVTNPDTGHSFVNTPSLALNGNGSDSFSAEMSAVDSAGTFAVRSSIYGYLKTSGSTSSTVVNVCQNSDGTGVVGSISVGSLYTDGKTAGRNEVTINKGSWSGGTVQFTKSAGTASNSGVMVSLGGSWSGNSYNYTIYDSWSGSAASTGYTGTIDASGRYTAGQNDVTITKGTWSGGLIQFTKSAGTPSTKTVQLTAATPTWEGNTASVKIYDGTSVEQGSFTGYTVNVTASHSPSVSSFASNGSADPSTGDLISISANYANHWYTFKAICGSSEKNYRLKVTPSLTTKTITSNDTYTPSSSYVGFSSVTVNVPGIDRAKARFNAGNSSYWIEAYDNTSGTAVSGSSVTYKLGTSGSTSSTKIQIQDTNDTKLSNTPEYSVGYLYTNGQNDVTITKGTWTNGIIQFTKSAGTSSTKTVQLTAATPTWSGNTASVKIYDGTSVQSGSFTGYTVNVTASHSPSVSSFSSNGSADPGSGYNQISISANYPIHWYTFKALCGSSETNYKLKITTSHSVSLSSFSSNGSADPGTGYNLISISANYPTHWYTFSATCGNSTKNYRLKVTPSLTTKTITSNDTYTPSAGYVGFSSVTVSVPHSPAIITDSGGWWLSPNSSEPPTQQYALLPGVSQADTSKWYTFGVKCGDNASKYYKFEIFVNHTPSLAFDLAGWWLSPYSAEPSSAYTKIPDVAQSDLTKWYTFGVKCSAGNIQYYKFQIDATEVYRAGQRDGGGGGSHNILYDANFSEFSALPPTQIYPVQRTITPAENSNTTSYFGIGVSCGGVSKNLAVSVNCSNVVSYISSLFGWPGENLETETCTVTRYGVNNRNLVLTMARNGDNIDLRNNDGGVVARLNDPHGSTTHSVSLTVDVGWTGDISGYESKGSYSYTSLHNTYIRVKASCGGSTKKYYYTIN